MNKLLVMGIGPGHPDYLLPVVRQRVKTCAALVGGTRNLALFPEFAGEQLTIKKDLLSLVPVLQKSLILGSVGVIVSGDPGFYSMLDFLKQHFSEEVIEVLPGISSFQYLYAKLGRPWHQNLPLSVHGRQADYLTALKQGRGVTLLTDSRQSPAAIAQAVLEAGLTGIRMVVGENLSYPRERIIQGSPETIIQAGPYQMAVVVIDYV